MPRRPAHQSRLLGLESEHQSQGPCCCHVDPQALDRENRQRHSGEHGGDDDESLTQVGGKRPHQKLDQVVEYAPPFLNGGFDGCEVVVGQHHVRCLLGDLGARNAHGNPDICLFERRRIVHAIARHGHDMPPCLKGAHKIELLLWSHSGENVGFFGSGDQFLRGKKRHLFAGENSRAGRQAFGLRDDADFFGDDRSRQGVVPRNHLDPNAGPQTGMNGFNGLFTGRIDHPLQAKES